MDGGRASILSPGNMSTKEKSPCQTVNTENESPCLVRVCKKLPLCQFEGSKKKTLQPRVKTFYTVKHTSSIYIICT